jgi:hypothetical protein
MIRKRKERFSEKIMLKQTDEIMIRLNLIGSRSRAFPHDPGAFGITALMPKRRWSESLN